MKRILLLSPLFLLWLSTIGAAVPLPYPPAPRGDVVDDYGGVKVPDPYRWMEELTSPQVHDWMTAENELTFGYLHGIPHRDVLLSQLKRLVNYRRWSAPAHEGGRWFFSRNDGLQNFSPILVSDTRDGEGRVLLDPNQWSSDGSVALGTWIPSEDGKRVLYARQGSGSDWMDFYVRDVDSAQDLPEVVHWAKFGGASWADAQGTAFYYLRFPEPKPGETYTGQNLNPMIYYHRVGSTQDADTLVYSIPEHPDWWISAGLTEDYSLLTLYVSSPGSINNRLYVQRTRDPGAPLMKIFDQEDASYGIISNEGDKLWIQTDKDAPNNRVIQVDLNHPEPANWVDVIPESRNPLAAGMCGGYIFATYLKDARNVVYRYRPDGTLVDQVKLPGAGTASGFGGYKYDTETYFTYADFTTPATIYRYDIPSGTTQVWRAPEFPVDLSRYESRLLFYRSNDGTAVPLFVLSRKGIQLDGSHPTILYGYGGFGGTQQPYFSSSRLAWLDMGGVVAVAGIRGGAEYGKVWHEAAIKTHRQVAFDDFIAAAEYLIDAGYTSTPRLAINGGSNGGLLVTAVEMQRPDLFAVALPQVPVTDMLRFNQFTAGKGWESDYGSPQNPEEFAALYAYSPYHNVKPGTCYPATLITTADTDDRVVPSHSFKLAAAMQAAQGCDNPVLLRVETAAGHGAGKPLDKTLEEIADIYAFALHNMGIDLPAEFQ